MGKKQRGLIISLIVCLMLSSSSVLLLVAAQDQELDTAQALYRKSISLVTNYLSSEVSRDASFCIVDPQTDWNKAFNYSSDLQFVSSCLNKTKGDASQRLCTAAEIKFYLNNYLKSALSGNPMYLRPNINCNRSSWISGCEPGWACRNDIAQKVDLKDADQEIPSRTSSCQPCCEGFFCPQGLTCMIPCPLGSYCPLAKLNEETSICEPYSYQLPAGRGTNHTCGGANIWANVAISKGIFCPAGSYCPSTTDNVACSSGHYCRMGSTTQTRCSKMISCKANTKNEDIHTYGIMFISALSALLLIVYSSADYILTIQERRLAKSREKAARGLQESEQARSRWQSAIDAVKKQPDLLQTSSARRHQVEPSTFDDEACTDVESGETSEGIIVTKKRVSRARAHSRDTQMFQKAYAQIEMEKSRERQKESLTFAQVISMVTSSAQIRKRPSIEVGFRDLTVKLKGKQKYLLRGLTGKIEPGHITVVMGPSGAGKTSFLSVLAGRTTGCTTSGQILINGKPESILSYKKITGFVPQDDVVYGNLTVEENLWFSARCRLSSDLRREDKVLIVERVIENLGLQEVRDSVVGTVEKRGISGGQRKRVNVGLEMVMEPSLMFLDEPTSGLDSASSLLLLRALKRETYEGVNICMVVHQPSYALFNMFDDLVLLAKGGFMVYHGLVEKVEAYFGSLGYTVPDRVSPPDFYIDILEGTAKPNASTGINYKELPTIWMLQNGYPVPEDMQSSVHSNMSEQQSFVGELCPDVRCDVELNGNHKHLNILWRRDLSNRRTPSILLQYKHFLGRVAKQRLREAKLQATDYLILLLAGACVGSITKISDADFGAFGYSYTIIAISLLCQVAALRSFSNDKLQYRRERYSGISSLAHFAAKDTLDHFNTLVKPAVYLSMFYFFTNPRSSFLDNYIVLTTLVYCVTGMGYAFAIFLDPGPAQLFSVLLPVCLTLVTTQSLNNDNLKFIANFCYPKWVLEALVIANARRYYGVWLISRCVALYKFQYSLHVWGLCIMVILLFGVGSRIIAFIGLLFMRRR